MSTNVSLILTASALIGCGVYLILERSLTRVLAGLLLMGNGVSILFLIAGGRAGDAPIEGKTDVADMADPLPQALVLTAIVIALATTAFLLAMAYRSWQLNANDDVQDDVEDASIRRLAAADEASDSHDLATGGQDDDEVTEEGA
ncbi:Na(+)/H(+) antiporter subunit C [Aeromicrobium sp. SMF47]|uniref:Na(+)/H(+) antiporter subunit C n=1 Tax=Aeromicrobium yanjiei TaxID=2662028 RepID=A0A5Q2MHS6_9ACTN|nr:MULTISPECIES: Na(+)/H(+) antiporter subunit C [Aeromicrobium]MRJ76142.1 Na(+)/H(+) antiporter subunit C [Aeromicrobium yanjiei]MRK00492.1 Na(+)/H(+) antiporter subunit C [Aeromicrobium sp. S22]QGG42667.1 Na(+)/H(+) antiporter subunit C [Aeromicrobium yanjiei]